MSREFSLKQKKKEDLIKLVLDLEKKLADTEQERFENRNDYRHYKNLYLTTKEKLDDKEQVVEVEGTFLKGKNYCSKCGFQIMGRPDFQPAYCHTCGRKLNWYKVKDFDQALQEAETEQLSKTSKIKITREQLKLINDVFNYALNFIDQTTETSMLIKQGQDGQFSELKYEDFEEDVTELASWLEKHFEIEKSDGGGNLLDKIIKEDSKN